MNFRAIMCRPYGTWRCQFNEKLIKRHKVYPGRIKPYLMEMQMLRNTADYENDTVSKKDASDQLRKAKEMIELIETEIEQ